jgi:peptidylprolyl isomerase
MPKKTLIKVFAFLAVLAIAFASITTLGGDDTVSGSAAGSAAGLPAVTGNFGEMPNIATPTGTAPTTLEKQDIIVGTGTEILPTSTLTVHYTLMAWSTGEILESSLNGGQPATFPLSGVIAGWQEGLPGAKVGSRRLLVIPPSLGYGPSVGHPLEKETLIFVVDVIAVS